MKLNQSRVLVTGAGGFIGSHLVEGLVREGAKVTALTHYKSRNDWGWLEDIGCLKEIRVVAGDIRDASLCRELCSGIDVVYHLGALIPIPYSYIAPDSYLDTNVRGTLNMCQAARQCGVRKFIHTSTSEVYGSAMYVPIDEKHPLQAQSPYSATKIGADAIALAFHASFEFPLLIARPFNAYGPRQSARALIPSIIVQLACGKKEVALGTLTTTRDFTFVEDTCRGFLALGTLDGRSGEIFHIGSNVQVSVGDLLGMIALIMDSPVQVKEDVERLRPRKSEVARLQCENTKLLDATGFRPSVPVEEGLRRTCEWFSCPENLKRFKGDIYNV